MKRRKSLSPTTRSDMGDWHVDQAARDWPALKPAKRPAKRGKRRQTKDERIAELEAENARLRRDLADERNRRDYERERKHPLVCRLPHHRRNGLSS